MREGGSIKTRFLTHVVDDGWRLPYEVVEEINIRIVEAKDTAYKRIKAEHYRHKGDWLTYDVARKYEAKSWIYRIMTGNQYCGKVKEIGEELQRLYGVTELEAVNILSGQNVNHYVNKYYRIQHMIPDYVNEQEICERVAEKYFKVI